MVKQFKDLKVGDEIYYSAHFVNNSSKGLIFETHQFAVRAMDVSSSTIVFRLISTENDERFPKGFQFSVPVFITKLTETIQGCFSSNNNIETINVINIDNVQLTLK